MDMFALLIPALVLSVCTACFAKYLGGFARALIQGFDGSWFFVIVMSGFVLAFVGIFWGIRINVQALFIDPLMVMVEVGTWIGLILVSIAWGWQMYGRKREGSL